VASAVPVGPAGSAWARAADDARRSRARPSASARRSRQQVVHRVHHERAQGVLVVRGAEDHDRRPRLTGDQLQHLEAIELRHLHVEEHQVGPLLGDRLHRLEAVRGLPDHLDALVGAEVLAQQRARRGFVVHEQDAQALSHAAPPRARRR
jgi:hypothetical protein